MRVTGDVRDPPLGGGHVSGPYKFGDVVDGYRWTVLGWEPVEGSEPAASAALAHALDTHLQHPAVPHHPRHSSAATLPPAPTEVHPQPGAPDQVGVDQSSSEPIATEGAAAAAVRETVAIDAGVSAQADQTGPARRWTAVGWEVLEDPEEPEPTVLEPTVLEPTVMEAMSAQRSSDADGAGAHSAVDIEDFADVMANAPSAPPREADDPEADVLVDLREASEPRTVTLPEPAAGWYPG